MGEPSTLEALRGALPEPDRTAEAIELDVSFSSRVFRFGDSVARIARNADVTRTHHNEARILPTLAGQLPVAVAVPVRVVEPSADVPFGALVQPFLVGAVLEREDVTLRLADEISACLAAIHAVPLDRFPAGAIQELDPIKDLDRLLPAVGAYLRTRLDAREQATFASVVERSRAVLPNRVHVFCHVDPWFGNWLVGEDGHLSALLDFENSAAADPAVDLAAQTYLADPVRTPLMHAYVARVGPLADLDDRVRCWRLLRELDGLAYCLRNDHDELDDTVRMVRASLEG